MKRDLLDFNRTLSWYFIRVLRAFIDILFLLHGQALRVCSHLGKLEIGGSADELEFEHDPKWGVGQMGQI